MKARRKSDGEIIEVESVDPCFVVDSIPFVLYYIDEEQTIYDETELNLIFPLSASEEGVTIEGEIYRDKDGGTYQPLLRVHRVSCGGYESVWDSGKPEYELGNELFPNLSSDSDPVECEITITIKPKKKNDSDKPIPKPKPDSLRS